MEVIVGIDGGGKNDNDVFLNLCQNYIINVKAACHNLKDGFIIGP
jgi:hypothetical protein